MDHEQQDTTHEYEPPNVEDLEPLAGPAVTAAGADSLTMTITVGS